MSWAYYQETTKKKDIAYCLIGFFDVNVPMLYGEGEKAFIQLQEEIMKHSDDQSLFVWINLDTPEDSHCGLLANPPNKFCNSAIIILYRGWEPTSPYSINNKVLRIELYLWHYREDVYIAALECLVPSDYKGFLSIFLSHVFMQNHHYARVKPQTLCKFSTQGRIETVYVRQSVPRFGPQDIYPVHFFKL